MAQSRKDNRGRVLRKGESYRSNDKRYVYTYTNPNGKRKFIYALDLAKLREKEDQLKRDQLDGLDVYVAGHATVNDVFDRYMSMKYDLKTTTKSNYIYMYNRFVRDTFGIRKIGEVKYSDIMQFYYYLLNKEGMQANTVDTIHTILHPTFQLAVRDDVIRKNPSDGVMAEIKKKAGKNKGIRHALTRDQQSAFMDFVANHPVYCRWWTVFTVLLGTGCRVGEFVGLRWQDVDTEKREISINHNVVQVRRLGLTDTSGTVELEVSTPKTEAGKRIIPMIDAVYDAFQMEYEEQQENGFNSVVLDGYYGFIFQNKNGNLLNQQNINSAIRRITADYNYEEQIKAKKERRQPVMLPKFSCHHLRHTFCTRLCETEPNLKIIMNIMGHSDIQTTMNIYAEAQSEIKKQSMTKLSTEWNKILESDPRRVDNSESEATETEENSKTDTEL